jgi:ferredoxin
MARVEVDQDLCIADEICASMYPEMFEMGDDGFAHVVEGMEEVEGENLDKAFEAAEACPTDAIIVEE